MPQRDRLSVSKVSGGKMFAKKMHRLVKKMQDKPADSLDPLDLLSEMARKRGENLSFPIEVETEGQWTTLLKREGLIVVDVHSGWSGPCTSMFSILRKLKLDTNDDRMILAAANADNIAQLAPFRNQSEPYWLFLGGGKPVKVIRGSNAPKLLKAIKTEFQHELACIEGSEKRNLVSIKFEASRREKAVTEAIALNELMVLEEEEKNIAAREPSKPPTPQEDEEKENDEENQSETPVGADVEESHEEEENDGDDENKAEQVEDTAAIDEALAERRRLMEESSIRLKDALRFYTVIAIQAYLLETGAVTEIKDFLAGDFTLIRERYINIADEDARKLFGIPKEIVDPNPYQNVEDSPDDDENSEADSHSVVSGDEKSHASAPRSPMPAIIDESKSEAVREDTLGDNDAEEINENEGTEEEGRLSRMKDDELPTVRMMAVPIPEVLIGDTLILLLECVRVKPLIKGESTAGELYEDADYFMAMKTGPEEYEVAKETQPESLHAMYGKEKYVVGVWGPRTYEEKRFVMLNYFPQFVTEMLMPPIPDPPKYHIFVFSALFSSDILENPEYASKKEDIIAAKRTRIPHKIAEKMLISSKREGDFLRALKWALTGTEVLIISVNGANHDLVVFLECFDPIFFTKDVIEAGYFTTKFFHDVEVLIDGDPFPQQVEEEVIGSCGFAIANLIGKIADNTVKEEAQQESDTEEPTGVSCEDGIIFAENEILSEKNNGENENIIEDEGDMSVNAEEKSVS